MVETLLIRAHKSKRLVLNNRCNFVREQGDRQHSGQQITVNHRLGLVYLSLVNTKKTYTSPRLVYSAMYGGIYGMCKSWTYAKVSKSVLLRIKKRLKHAHILRNKLTNPPPFPLLSFYYNHDRTCVCSTALTFLCVTEIRLRTVCESQVILHRAAKPEVPLFEILLVIPT